MYRMEVDRDKENLEKELYLFIHMVCSMDAWGVNTKIKVKKIKLISSKK